MTRSRGVRFLVDVSIVVAIAAASLAYLPHPFYDYIFVHGWTQYAEILPVTTLAALRVWTFWAVAAAILAGVLLRIAPGLGLVDAALAGATGLWVCAFVAGVALSPIALFQSWTIWAVLAAGALWLWRTGFPEIELHAPSAGLKLALLTFVIAVPSLLTLQLGSPVAPHMDVLATPAAAQRILTFGYFPFDNDPYGYWGPFAQTPALELFYAFLALGSGTSLAVLAQTAAMVPMAGLLILAIYRLGRTIGGDVVGGMATVGLLATVFFRVLHGMHGRVVTFVLLGVGLAFVLDRRRNATRLVLGALMLGTAVASHAIYGALGMAVASSVVLLWLLSGDVASFLAGIGLMAGASLFAFPVLAVAFSWALPFPILMLTQLLAVVVVVVSARRLSARPMRDPTVARLLRWAMALLAVILLAWRPSPLMKIPSFLSVNPIILIGAILGLLVMIGLDSRRPSRVLLSPAVVAILLGIAVEYTCARLWDTFGDVRLRFVVHDTFHKLDYWYPFALLIPAACLAATLFQRVSRRMTVLAILALVFFPWKANSWSQANYAQFSVVESFAHQWYAAKTGYWHSTGHRRWAQSADQLELAELLRQEIAAGRITRATHIVHLSPYIVLYQDTLLFSLYTGVNDDVYIADYKVDGSIAGGRMRPIEEAPVRIAERPPYVAIHESTLNGKELPPDARILPQSVEGEYEEIFNRKGVRLYRRRDLTSGKGEV